MLFAFVVIVIATDVVIVFDIENVFKKQKCYQKNKKPICKIVAHHY
jgi:hypothetical protein